MDDRGYWHNERRESHVMETLKEEIRTGERPRYVIACEIGETVTVMKADDTFVRCTFLGAEKNKATLRPIEQNAHQPYLELAERVRLENESGVSVVAQVWDNRGGKIILRTLPVGS